MLTQDDFVAPNMSGEGHPRRSSWKADAIRRGDLKISGPIPITEDMPLSEDEEREYAEKHPAEAPLPSVEEQEEQTPHPPPPAHAPPSIPDDAPVQDVDAVENRPQTREEVHNLRHKNSTSAVRDDAEMQRSSYPEPASYSSPSPLPPGADGSAKTTPKKKRKSGLRNAFRKMFGRRSRGESEERDGGTNSRGHSRVISEPVLRRTSSERKPPRRGQRISDLPVREPAPINPLGQHLPFPMNVNAPQEASPPHQYLTFERPPPELSRRATLPSVLPDAETQSLGGRGKRLEAWEEEKHDESIPSPQIGLALSSPSHAPHPESSRQSKRRSRSAGALHDLTKGRASVERRRSAEIRYWRHSHASASIYSTNTPRPRTAQTVDTVRSVEARDTVPKPFESATEITETTEAYPPQVAQHDQNLSENQLPVEAFNFGNLKSDFSDDEGSEEPAAPPLRSEKRLSIEDRVKHLEDDVRTLESSVHRLSGRTNRQTIILENAPKGRRSSQNRSSSGTSERQGSHHSSRESNHTLHFRREEADASTEALNPPLSAVNEDHARPISTANDANPAKPSNRDTVVLHSEHVLPLAVLQAALTHERHARRALEAQVSTLHHDLAALHLLVRKLLNTTSPSYPTPSPDAIISSSEERMATPRANRTGDALEVDVAAGSGSGRDTDSVTSSREDFSPEDWATPKEESGFGSGFFSSSRRREEAGEIF